MAARILRAHQTGTEIVLIVHLDERRTRRDGDPDPAYVRRWTWPLFDPANPLIETRAAYLARIRQEARALVQTTVAEIEAENIASITGQVL